MNTSLVVFDIAGTTVSDSGNINQSFREAFASEGLSVSEYDVNTVMGYRKIEAISIIVDKYSPGAMEKDPDLVNRMHNRFNRDMVLFYQKDRSLKPLPYAEETFALLQQHGIKVALNTGFTREITDAILERLGWKNNPLINAVVCSDEVPEGRPNAYMIQSIMKQLGITDMSSVVKVGDTEVDVLEGQHAGCGLVVAVTTGAYTREQLASYKPDFIIDSLRELPALILH
ncbi:MAG: HAD hydrolase-like protein [Bacteroidota bacterium]|nr:HAD hydrolase-like protein [Bacteroidota bacterium]